MATYRIPEKVARGFDAITKISNKDVVDIYEMLMKLPFVKSPNSFIKELSTNSQIEGIEFIANALLVLSGSLPKEDSKKDFIFELCNSYRDLFNKNLGNDELERLRNNLLKLTSNIDNLKLVTKALSLITDNSNIYKDGNILTDIRLVFKDDLEDSNRGGLIIHKLKIEYLNSGIQNDFYISLDIGDLNNLKGQIERAQEKERLIREAYKNSISFIDLND